MSYRAPFVSSFTNTPQPEPNSKFPPQSIENNLFVEENEGTPQINIEDIEIMNPSNVGLSSPDFGKNSEESVTLRTRKRQ